MSSSAVTGGQSGVDAGTDFCAAVDDALSTGRPEAVPDDSLQRVLSAAVSLYAAQSEARPRELPPFGDRPVNATEAVTAVAPVTSTRTTTGSPSADAATTASAISGGSAAPTGPDGAIDARATTTNPTTETSDPVRRLTIGSLPIRRPRSSRGDT